MTQPNDIAFRALTRHVKHLEIYCHHKQQVAAALAFYSLKKPEAHRKAIELYQAILGFADRSALQRLRCPELRSISAKRAPQYEMICLWLSMLIHINRKHALRWQEYGEDEGPTPEAWLKPRSRDPITVLKRKGYIGADDEHAAGVLARILEALAASTSAKTSNLESAGRPPRRSHAFNDLRFSEYVAELHHNVYQPWTWEMARAGLPLSIVTRVVVDGESVKAVASYHRMRWDNAARQIARGIKLFTENYQDHKEFQDWAKEMET